MNPEDFYAVLAEYVSEQYDDLDNGYYKFCVEIVKGNDSDGHPYILFATQSLNDLTEDESAITKAYVERMMEGGDLN